MSYDKLHKNITELHSRLQKIADNSGCLSGAVPCIDDYTEIDHPELQESRRYVEEISAAAGLVVSNLADIAAEIGDRVEVMLECMDRLDSVAAQIDEYAAQAGEGRPLAPGQSEDSARELESILERFQNMRPYET